MNIPELAGHILTELRSPTQRTVHCIVGAMAEATIAETLQAVGVIPSMTHDVREVDDFVDDSRAVLIQLSTHSDSRESGILTAVDTARRTGKPWVLNVRSAQRSVFRRELARRMADNRPRIVVGRSHELSAAMRLQSGVKLPEFAVHFKTTAVKLGGDRVEIADPLQQARIENNSALINQVNAMDCATAALCAAFASVEVSGFKAACAASLVSRIACERASLEAKGPGSFMVNFLDEISTLTPDIILAEAKFERLMAELPAN